MNTRHLKILLSDVATTLTCCQFEPNVTWHCHGQDRQCFVRWGLIVSETQQIMRQNIITIFSLFLCHSPHSSLCLFHSLTLSVFPLYSCLSFNLVSLRSCLQCLRGQLWGSSSNHLQWRNGGGRPDAQCLCSECAVPHLFLWDCGW